MVQLEELECGCCYELLVEPTTLTCGHSFCRYCLAKWHGMQNANKSCPECRQVWTGVPRVNVHLRTIIEKSYPTELKERNKSLTNYGDYHDTLKTFDSLVVSGENKSATPALNQEQIQTIIGVVIIIAVGFLVAALLSFLLYLYLSATRSGEVTFQKAVEKWDTKEVAAWVQQISTTQLEQDYSGRFTQAKIVGKVLMTLTEEDLASPPLNIENALHRKMITAEIVTLDEKRFLRPKNMWEYKKAHSSNALFLLFMAQEYPRFIFMYLHFFEYYTIFLPFVDGMMPITQGCSEFPLFDDKTTCLQDGMSYGVLLKFYLRVLFYPYGMMAMFCTAYSGVHLLTISIILCQCAMLAYLEFKRVTRSPSIRRCPRIFLDNIMSFMATCVWYWAILTITPNFICNIVFYAKFYYGPIDTANNIRKGNFENHQNIATQILNVCKRTCIAVWGFFWFLIHRRAQN